MIGFLHDFALLLRCTRLWGRVINVRSGIKSMHAHDRATLVPPSAGPSANGLPSLCALCTTAGKPPYAALESLAQVVYQHSWVDMRSTLDMQSGPAGRALTSLAVTHYARLSRDLMALQPVSGAAAQQAQAAQRHRDLMEDVLPIWEAGYTLLDCVGDWPTTTVSTEAAALPAVAATVQLLRLTVGLEKPWTWLEAAVNAMLLLHWPALQWDPATGAVGPPRKQRAQWRRSQQGQQQQHREAGPKDRTCLPVPVPDSCIEAAAVACSALCAPLEARWRAHFGNVG